MGKYERGSVAYRLKDLESDKYTEWLMVRNRIYNVTKYLDAIKDNVTGDVDLESENAYLSEDLNRLIINKRGEDATLVYKAAYKNDVALSCLDELFYVGVLDEEADV